MTPLSAQLTGLHRKCDQVFAQAEEAAAEGDLRRTLPLFEDFARLLEAHLRDEEETVFPAFEQATGMTMGPTQMMRIEHGQMRAIATKLKEALDSKNLDDFLGYAENLHLLIQQHNMKEEQILYRMIDQHLGDETAVIAPKITPV